MVKNLKYNIPSNSKPMIFFMTDGEPTSGETDVGAIKRNVAAENKVANIPIHGLAFGPGADFALIKSISDQNHGKSKQ